MKKFILKLLSTICVFVLSLNVFTACGGSSHTHDYKMLNYDAENHWYECSCGEKSNLVAHILVNNTCVCGYVKPEEHTHNYYIVKYDTENHWFECECGEKSSLVSHVLINNICICGYEKAEEHIHNYNTLKYDSENHWYECACGKKQSEASHRGGTATCTVKAKCDICNQGYGALLNHNYNTVNYDGSRHWIECACGAKNYWAEHNFVFGACSCGYVPNIREDTSYFFIITTDSGIGSAGTKELARRFEEKFKDYSFAPGKTGVVVDVEAKGSNLYTTAIAQEAYHCYINPKSVDNSMIGSGGYLNIDEFIKTEIPGEGKTIEDKIPENYRPRLQGESSKWGKGYYFAPGVSYMGGLTYDKNCFDEYGFYFLAPDQEECYWFYSELMDQEVYFADPHSPLFEEATAGKGYDNWDGWNSNRYLSCGPDGIYGTYDDGMASSLDELVMLCEYMKNNSVTPFVLSGKYPDNHAYCTDGLINSLLGPENMYTMKTFESDAFEVVTGYQDNTELWGMSDTKLPTTAVVPVKPSQGYYATWSTARYYNAAFWRLAVKQNWYTSTVKKDTSHIEAQADFIFSGYDSSRERSAIMLESSYWINESQERNNFSDFTKMNYGKTGLEREKEIKWMSLPRQIHGKVDEGVGTPEPFMYLNGGPNNLFNAIYATDPEALEMIKQWLLFFYSDESLQFLTASTGCPILIDYDINTQSSLYDNEPFYKDLFNRMNRGIAISPNDAPIGGLYHKYPELFAKHGWGSCWTGLDSEGRTELYSAYAIKNYSVQHCFEKAVFFMSKKEWAYVFDADMGTSAMPPTSEKDENGNEITYRSSTIGVGD